MRKGQKIKRARKPEFDKPPPPKKPTAPSGKKGLEGHRLPGEGAEEVDYLEAELDGVRRADFADATGLNKGCVTHRWKVLEERTEVAESVAGAVELSTREVDCLSPQLKSVRSIGDDVQAAFHRMRLFADENARVRRILMNYILSEEGTPEHELGKRILSRFDKGTQPADPVKVIEMLSKNILGSGQFTLAVGKILQFIMRSQKTEKALMNTLAQFREIAPEFMKELERQNTILGAAARQAFEGGHEVVEVEKDE